MFVNGLLNRFCFQFNEREKQRLSLMTSRRSVKFNRNYILIAFELYCCVITLTPMINGVDSARTFIRMKIN